VNLTLIRQPAAWLPLAMSSLALASVLGFVSMYGALREADEGAAAHVWQFLMLAQGPIVVAFALKWLPRAPSQAWRVLALQASAALLALAPVLFLGL